MSQPICSHWKLLLSLGQGRAQDLLNYNLLFSSNYSRGVNIEKMEGLCYIYAFLLYWKNDIVHIVLLLYTPLVWEMYVFYKFAHFFWGFNFSKNIKDLRGNAQIFCWLPRPFKRVSESVKEMYNKGSQVPGLFNGEP